MKIKRLLFVAAILLKSGCFIAAQDRRLADSKDRPVEVYTSSMNGERLSRKSDVFFRPFSAGSLPVITVNEDTTFQKIEGFGATFNEAGLICLNTLDRKHREEVLSALFDSVRGAGFTVMKSPIGACDFASAGPWYSYDEVPGDTLLEHFSIGRDLGPNGLITYIKQAATFGRFRIESPMDFAPDWMYYSLKPGEKHIQPIFYKALARYYSKYLQAYATNGVAIDYLNLFNEANNSWYSNVTYQEIGMLIRDYVVPQLRADGIPTKIQLGETSNRPEALEKFPSVLNDTVVRNYVSSLTVHGYDWNKFSSLAGLHDRYPDLPIWMTEVCYAYGPDVNNIPKGAPTKMPVYGFEDGAFWGNMIVNDMKNQVSAWVYWNMILDEKGGPWLVSKVHGDPDSNFQHPVVIINRHTKKVSYTGLYYYLTHFSRFVRPGAYRISSGSGSSPLNFVAFQNPDHEIVLNVINNGPGVACAIRWRDQIFQKQLSAHSITTFRWKGSFE